MAADEHDDAADHDLLPEVRDIEQHHPIVDGDDDQNSDRGADHASGATEQRRTANDHGRYRATITTTTVSL